MGRPFTEEHEFQGTSWAQVAADPKLLGWLRENLGLPKDGDARRALLDPERVRDALRTLPPAQLLAIRALLVVGGAARFAVLRRELEGTDFGVEVDDLYHHLIDVGVLVGQAGGHPGAFIIRELGPVLAAELWPLGLPEGRDAPALDGGDDGEVLGSAERLMLVIAGRLAQVPVKITRSGRANKTSLKRFVKGSGLSLEVVSGIIDEMAEQGLIESDGSHFYPLRDRLLDHCGPRAHSPLHQALLTTLAEHGPLPRAAAIDAVKLQVRLDHPAFWDVQELFPEDLTTTSVLTRVPAFVAETPAVRWEGDWMLPRSSPVDGDGFVTPAFDVMVGPRTPPEVLLTVATAASVRSVEQMVTFHLEPQSVAGARAHGVDAVAILDALDRLCPHPVPDNVAHMVREWAAAARVARVRRVWVVEGPTDAPLGAIGEQVAPGRVHADGDFEDVAAAVRAAGLRLAQPTTAREHRDRQERAAVEQLRYRALWDRREPFDDDEDDALDVTWFAPCWFGDGADEELAARVAAARRGERPWAEVTADDNRMASDAVELMALLKQLIDEARPELRMAFKRFGPAEARRLNEVFGPESGEPHRFFMLSRKWRRRAVKQSRSVDELLARVDELWSPGRTSETGARVFAIAAAHLGERPTLERLRALAGAGTPLIVHLGDADPVVGTIASVQERPDGAWVLLDTPEDPGRGHSIALSSIERVVTLGPESP